MPLIEQMRFDTILMEGNTMIMLYQIWNHKSCKNGQIFGHNQLKYEIENLKNDDYDLCQVGLGNLIKKTL